MANDFVCPECGQRFSTEKAMMEHMMSNHPKAAMKMEPFECKVCGARFHTEADLKEHRMKAHRM